ncbi:MAG: alanine racemase [Eggerthellaceae bacterium]|nr:alanine racemase [Eggerthellaceae bacterium]
MMEEPLNGFTGFNKKEPGFVSAKDAIRQDEIEAIAARAKRKQDKAGAWSAPAPSASFMESPWNANASVKNFVSVDPENESRLIFDEEKLATIPEPERRWSWVEIDLSAIRHNLSAIKGLTKSGTHVMAVVKDDAYGHGAVPVAKMCLNSGADYLGVATIDEAIELREAHLNAPILVLSEPPATAIPLLLGYKVMPSVYTAEFAIQYAEAADSLGLKAPYHLAVNTGMNRIGVRYDEVVEFMSQVSFHRALDLVGTFTHFATADAPETFELQNQVTRFIEAINAMRLAGIDPGIVHAANCAAAIRFPELHFDMIRLGICLYGYQACPETAQIVELHHAMAVKARITDCRYVPMSEGVSYGLNYRSPGSVKICTIPIGYGDGLRRGLSGKISFIMGGKLHRQVGNICMDQCMFEVDMRTYASQKKVDPQIGDEVIIVGTEGDFSVTVEHMCSVLDTIPHEVVIGLGSSRMPRIYI